MVRGSERGASGSYAIEPSKNRARAKTDREMTNIACLSPYAISKRSYMDRAPALIWHNLRSVGDGVGRKERVERAYQI